MNFIIVILVIIILGLLITKIQEKKNLIKEVKDYIREDSLLTQADKAEMIGYLDGISRRPYNK